MNVEEVLRKGIQLVANKRYDEAVSVLQAGLDEHLGVASKTEPVTSTTSEPEDKKLTKSEIYALDKDEQSVLIKKLGGEDTKVPRLEKNRVDLILKLQKG